jgi:enoyl-CoA hydratase/carnithine racemase
MALHNLDKPTIAAVNGVAAGFGADIALACDFIIASPAARFMLNFTQRGLVPDGGGMYLLPRRVGLPKAKELYFSAQTVSADGALRIGLVDRIAQPEALIDQALGWASDLSRNSAPAIALAKSILNQTFESSLETIFSQGSKAQAICYSSDEHHEAINSFLRSK